MGELSKTPPFWLVWNPSNRQPRFQHETYIGAREEAERLARKCPGQSFYVLTPVARGCTSDAIVWAHYERTGIDTLDDLEGRHGPQIDEEPSA